MLVLSRRTRQRICIGKGIRNPKDNPSIVITVVDVKSPYVRIVVECNGEKQVHNMIPLDALNFGDGIMMQIASINYGEVKFAFDAPRKYRILRGEL